MQAGTPAVQPLRAFQKLLALFSTDSIRVLQNNKGYLEKGMRHCVFDRRARVGYDAGVRFSRVRTKNLEGHEEHEETGDEKETRNSA